MQDSRLLILELNYHATWKKFIKSFVEFKYHYTNEKRFDFSNFLKNGRTLLLGEGNLSFSLSLAQRQRPFSFNLVATTYESEKDIGEVTAKNAELLRNLGSEVLYDVDARRIDERFSGKLFELIAFQFPNVGSRDPIYGKNPNHILVRRFLRAAKPILGKNGKVAITVVNTPFYDGAFDMEGAAQEADYRPPETYPFDPEYYPGYQHVNTLDSNDSAIHNHDKFITFVFSPKQ